MGNGEWGTGVPVAVAGLRPSHRQYVQRLGDSRYDYLKVLRGYLTRGGEGTL